MEQQDLTLEQVIEQSFDFSGLTEEEKQKTIQDASGMILETTLLRTLDQSSEEAQEKFSAFVETQPTEDQMTEYVTENLPAFPEILIEELKIFQGMGKEAAQEINEKIEEKQKEANSAE